MTDTNTIDLTIEEAERQIKLGEDAQKLLNNPEFKSVIGDGYFRAEPARLSSLLGDIGGSYRWAPSNGSTQLPMKEFIQMQDNIERDLHSVGALQSYLRVVLWRAERAREALDDLEQMKHQQVTEIDEASR